VRFAEQLKPDQATLVPEKRAELTTEGGLDCVRGAARLRRTVERLGSAGITVSAFITPEPAQIEAAAEAGCHAVELHTGMYANSRTARSAQGRIAELHRARDLALRCRLTVHAGHGLTYRNTGPVAAVGGICEFNIGHSIVSRAMFVGMRQATAEMIELIDKYDPRGG
jgi:pyridoxine 5-phosphate synthase